MGRRRRRSRGAGARHHGRDQCAAAGRDRGPRPDRHRRLPPYPRNRPASGAGRLRQFVFLGEAGADRAAALRPRGRRPTQFPRRGVAPARRGLRARRRALLPRRRHQRGRHLSHPLVRQPGARAPRRRDRARGISGLHAVAILRRAAGIPRIRARGDDVGRRLHQAAYEPLISIASATSSARS